MRKRKSQGKIRKFEKGMQTIFGFLIVIGVLVLTAVALLFYKFMFVSDLYQAFVFDYIGTTLFFLAGFVLCIFFLYHILIITIKNPQKLKNSVVLRWGAGGIVILFISFFIISEGRTFFVDSMKDMQDYKNGKWKIEDLEVVDVYRGGDSEIVIIETEVGDLSLHWEVFRLHEGETYRFTYLERTGTVLNVEEN